MESKLEDRFREPYDAWKAAPGPDTTMRLLEAAKPDIERVVRRHAGTVDPSALSQARLLAAKSLPSYDPARGTLFNHLFGRLQSVKRTQRSMLSGVRVPERLALEHGALASRTAELEAELGRAPSDAEIADRWGIHPKRLAKLRTYRPATAVGAFTDEETGNEATIAATPAGPAKSMWLELVADDLDPYHRNILDMALGRGGRRPMSNEAIAAALKRSPGAISQAKARIQALLDREKDLSPFGGG